MRDTEENGTHDIGVENDLLHHVCMVRYEEIYAMLEIVIEIYGERKLSNVTVRKHKQMTCKMAPDFHPRCDRARE